MFVDSDDAITPTALDELYSLAEKFDADVVYCEKFFNFTEDIPQIYLRKDFTVSAGHQLGGFVNEPTLETRNFEELIQKFCNKHFEAATWNKLTRRRLIAQNNIEFPYTRTYEDFIFNFKALCFAERYLRVPNIIYFYRDVPNSNSKPKKADLSKTLNFGADTIIKGLKVLDEFMNEFEFFNQHLDYRYSVLNLFVNFNLPHFLNFSVQAPPHIVHEILKRGDVKNLKNVDVLVAYLFSCLSMQRAEAINVINQYQQRIIQMDEHIQKQNELIRQLQQK